MNCMKHRKKRQTKPNPIIQSRLDRFMREATTLGVDLALENLKNDTEKIKKENEVKADGAN